MNLWVPADSHEAEMCVALMPFTVEQPLTLDQISMARDPSGTPTSLAAMGQLADTREPLAILQFETPTQAHLPISKTQQELDHARLALHLLYGTESIKETMPGGDPPDVLAIARTGLTLRIEVTQLHAVTADTVNAPTRWLPFEKLRTALLADAVRMRRRLRAHHGKMLCVWFRAPTTELRFDPPARNPRSVESLTTFLETTVPSQPLRSDLPLVASPDSTAQSSDGNFGVTWLDVTERYTSPFMTALGFELALVHSGTMYQSTVGDEIRRLILKHDKPNIDLLVITTNSPLRSGLQFPSGELVSALAMDRSDHLGTFTTENVRNVLLLDAASGRRAWLLGSAPPLH